MGRYKHDAPKKVNADYSRTKDDFYRMDLDRLDEVHPINRRHMRKAYFAYLQNTPGSKKAIKECVKDLNGEQEQKVHWREVVFKERQCLLQSIVYVCDIQELLSLFYFLYFIVIKKTCMVVRSFENVLTYDRKVDIYIRDSLWFVNFNPSNIQEITRTWFIIERAKLWYKSIITPYRVQNRPTLHHFSLF